MTKNISRNAPCSCGSGKKYKKCCLLKVVPKKAPLTFDEMSEIISNLMARHLAIYFNQLMELSDCETSIPFEEFLLNDHTNISPIKDYYDLLSENVFIPWVMFFWIPGNEFDGISAFDKEKTVAENYLVRHEKRLSPKEKSIIQGMKEGFFSFYRVEKVMPDKVVVADLLLDEEYTVLFPEGGEKGQIVFACIVALGDQKFFMGMAPLDIPPEYLEEILEMKAFLIEENDGASLTPRLLHEDFECHVRDCFFDIMQDFLEIPLRMPKNSDGEVKVDAELRFSLTLPVESAFNRLAPLMGTQDPESLLEDAERDGEGQIAKIKFAWLAGSEQGNGASEAGVLGWVTLESDMLLLETDSEERAETGYDLIEELLGDSVSFQTIKKTTPEFIFESITDFNQSLYAEALAREGLSREALEREASLSVVPAENMVVLSMVICDIKEKLIEGRRAFYEKYLENPSFKRMIKNARYGGAIVFEK